MTPRATTRLTWAPRLPFACLCAFVTVAAVVEPVARADDTIKRPGDHPAYSVEAEPHVLFGWGDAYGVGGFGLGGRFSIPVVKNGFVPSINDSVAVTFGIDWMHYESCWFRGGCVANYVHLPVALQWNFYVAKRWSVFGEPGLVIFFGSYDNCPLQGNLCPSRPPGAGAEPAIFLGGRYHLSDTMSLTMRIGFPTFSFGLSFFP